MIAIINKGGIDPSPAGVRTYEIRINHKVVTTLQHARSDGLAALLRKAADAVDRETWAQAGRDIATLLDGIDSRP